MMHAPSPALHIHLDAVGGVAGDMFLAALLAWRPELAEMAVAAARAVGVPPEWTIGLQPHRAEGFVGMRFAVEAPADHDHHGAHHHHHHDHDHHHHHVRHREVVARIDAASLPSGVRTRAKAIFALLAEAEAKVHGVDPAEVAFHEVADWDSIADIVGAAAVIEALGPATWSVSSLPLGGGTVQTAHGRLPVPAPATAILLQGFTMHDDGVQGERVTPTGAAILAHLRPEQGRRPDGRLIATAAGFGTRRMPGLPNMLRALVFEPLSAQADGTADRVAILSFEVDDQTAEDLAAGLERVRALAGVLDVLQYPAFGKKNRMVASVRVLCESDAADRIAEACLAETSTLGVRVQTAARRILAREQFEVPAAPGAVVRVKAAARPGGRRTAKAEMDDLATLPGGRKARAAVRAQVEGAVLRHKGRKDE